MQIMSNQSSVGSCIPYIYREIEAGALQSIVTELRAG